MGGSRNRLEFLWLVVIALAQMRPTLVALGDLEAPLNQFANIALVFEEVKRFPRSGGALSGSKGALSESSSSEQTGGIDQPGGSSPPFT